MTRKQALFRAAALLSQLPQDEETRAVQTALEELAADLPITVWDEKTVFDTVEQFFLDHGRYPNAKEFESKGLPSHPTVRNRFGMTVVEFLDAFYPNRYHYVHRTIRKYREYPKEHWLKIFREQMQNQKIRTAAEYNHKLTQGPGWAYIAHLYGLNNWGELLKKAEIQIAPPPPKEKAPLTVSRKSRPLDIQTLRGIQEHLQQYMLRDGDNT